MQIQVGIAPRRSIWLGVKFDVRLGLTEVGPREKCQRQIDGGGVERIDGVFQIQSEVFAGIERPGLAHE